MVGSLEGAPFRADDVTEAYVYLLGRYLVIRQEAIDVAEPGGGYNVLKHNPPVNAGDTAGSAPTFVNPNLDVVYSEAWLAVDADTPVIVEIPEIPAGLYYTAQIVDSIRYPSAIRSRTSGVSVAGLRPVSSVSSARESSRTWRAVEITDSRLISFDRSRLTGLVGGVTTSVTLPSYGERIKESSNESVSTRSPVAIGAAKTSANGGSGRVRVTVASQRRTSRTPPYFFLLQRKKYLPKH